jgi:hypothetical protein
LARSLQDALTTEPTNGIREGWVVSVSSRQAATDVR